MNAMTVQTLEMLEEASSLMVRALQRSLQPLPARDAGVIEYDSWSKPSAGSIEYDSWSSVAHG